VGEKLNSEKSLPIEQLPVPIFTSRSTTFKIRTGGNDLQSNRTQKKKLWTTTTTIQGAQMEIDGGKGEELGEDMLDYEVSQRFASLGRGPMKPMLGTNRDYAS